MILANNIYILLFYFSSFLLRKATNCLVGLNNQREIKVLRSVFGRRPSVQNMLFFSPLVLTTLWFNHSHIPTILFTILDPQNPQIDKIYVVQERCATGFKAPKL